MKLGIRLSIICYLSTDTNTKNDLHLVMLANNLSRSSGPHEDGKQTARRNRSDYKVKSEWKTCCYTNNMLQISIYSNFIYTGYSSFSVSSLVSIEALWFKCTDFREGGKLEYPKKNPRSTGEINYGKLNSHELQNLCRCTPDLAFSVGEA